MRNALEEREEELRVLKVEMGDLVKVEDTKEQREEVGRGFIVRES